MLSDSMMLRFYVRALLQWEESHRTEFDSTLKWGHTSYCQHREWFGLTSPNCLLLGDSAHVHIFRWPHFQDGQHMVVPGATNHANSWGSEINGSSPWEFSDRTNQSLHTQHRVKIAGGDLVPAIIFYHLRLQGDKRRAFTRFQTRRSTGIYLFINFSFKLSISVWRRKKPRWLFPLRQELILILFASETHIEVP